MRVFVDAQLRIRKGGWAAYDICTGLTGHGVDKEGSLDSLQRAVLAWCVGLNKAGYLEAALSSKAFQVDRHGDGLVVVVRQST